MGWNEMKEMLRATAAGTLHWMVAAVLTILIAGFTSWLFLGSNHEAGCSTKPCYLALEARIIALERRVAVIDPKPERAAK